MSVISQISGNIYPGDSPLRSLKSALSLVGIPTAHLSHGGSLFYEADSHAGWRRYDSEILLYKSIADSSFHIIYSDQPINNAIALQIIYAMLNDRPILITGEPTLSHKLFPFMRTVITKHARSFHSVQPAELGLTELSILLNKLKPIDYSLSKNEKILIKAGVKMHFRHLLEEAKERKRSAS